jgi:hypothetical protein
LNIEILDFMGGSIDGGHSNFAFSQSANILLQYDRWQTEIVTHVHLATLGERSVMRDRPIGSTIKP